MKGQLHQGQKLEIYEVIGGYDEDPEKTSHYVPTGTHIHLIDRSAFLSAYAEGEYGTMGYLLMESETKRCDYYIKVKSLK